MKFDAQAFIEQFTPPPIHIFLGGQLEHFDSVTQRLYLSYQSRPEFSNPMGHLQGGMLAAMLDDAMGVFALIGHEGKPAATVSMTVGFLRPTQLAEVKVEVYFVRQGRKISNIEAIAYQKEKELAKISAIFTVV